MSARLTTAPIEPAALLAEVADASHGATSLFVGTVRSTNEGREVNGIEYKAYEAMAVAEMNRILDEVNSLYPGVRSAAVHRVGHLKVGDTSVAIACAHAHRAQAIEACRHVIEDLKRRVPIWKREHYVDGTREWVGASHSHAEASR